MQTIRLTIDDIHIGERTRPLDEARVGELASSIRAVGLLQPVSVRILPSVMIDGEEWLQVATLIAGRHRLAALTALGETHVECQVLDLGDLQAELAEIDENLMRVNLTPAQEAAHIARRKEIYVELHPDTKPVTERGGPGRGKNGRQIGDRLVDRFSAATSRSTGRSERSVQRSAERAKKLGTDLLDRIAGTSLDKGAELDALTALPEERREELVARAAAGEAVSARPQMLDLLAASTGKDAAAPSAIDRLLDQFLALSVAEQREFVSRAAAHLDAGADPVSPATIIGGIGIEELVGLGLRASDRVEDPVELSQPVIALPPIRNFVPHDRSNLDPRRNKRVVTIFNISAMGRCVAADAGPLASLTEGPYAQYERYIQAKILGNSKNVVLGIGGGWPYWLVVIEGDHKAASFPTDPDRFDAWFPAWVQEKRITIIGDWRDEARADGALEWLKRD